METKSEIESVEAKLAAIRERRAKTTRLDCGTSDIGRKCVAYIYEAEPPYARVAMMEDLYDMQRANFLAHAPEDIDTLLSAYEALEKEFTQLVHTNHVKQSLLAHTQTQLASALAALATHNETVEK